MSEHAEIGEKAINDGENMVPEGKVNLEDLNRLQYPPDVAALLIHYTSLTSGSGRKVTPELLAEVAATYNELLRRGYLVSRAMDVRDPISGNRTRELFMAHYQMPPGTVVPKGYARDGINREKIYAAGKEVLTEGLLVKKIAPKS